MTQELMKTQPKQPKLADIVAGYAQGKRSEIVAFAGSDSRADKFIADMKMLCVDANLAACEPVTIFMASLNALQLNLSIVKQQGQAWVLPYNNKGKTQAQLQLGYKGWRLICKRAGYDIDCELVFKCDQFDYSMNETGRKISFKPAMTERKTTDSAWLASNLVGAIVWIYEGSRVKSEFVPGDKLAKIRATSKSSNSPAWRDWAEEMYKGKAIKYVASKLPSENDTMARAVEMDNEGHSLELKPRQTLNLVPDLPEDAIDADFTVNDGQSADELTDEEKAAAIRAEKEQSLL